VTVALALAQVPGLVPRRTVLHAREHRRGGDALQSHLTHQRIEHRLVAATVAGPIDELLNRVRAFGHELVIVLDDVQTVMPWRRSITPSAISPRTHD
jgi:hypothetical protein